MKQSPLWEVTVVQLVKKVLLCNATRRSITIFSCSNRWTLCSASWMQFLMIKFQSIPGSPVWHYTFRFLTTILYTFLLILCMLIVGHLSSSETNTCEYYLQILLGISRLVFIRILINTYFDWNIVLINKPRSVNKKPTFSESLAKIDTM
jgi:hypothetical protein